MDYQRFHNIIQGHLNLRKQSIVKTLTSGKPDKIFLILPYSTYWGKKIQACFALILNPCQNHICEKADKMKEECLQHGVPAKIWTIIRWQQRGIENINSFLFSNCHPDFFFFTVWIWKPYWKAVSLKTFLLCKASQSSE